jgi:hypothetical protein
VLLVKFSKNERVLSCPSGEIIFHRYMLPRTRRWICKCAGRGSWVGGINQSRRNTASLTFIFKRREEKLTKKSRKNQKKRTRWRGGFV